MSLVEDGFPMLSGAFSKDIYAECKSKTLFCDSGKVKPASVPGAPAPGPAEWAFGRPRKTLLPLPAAGREAVFGPPVLSKRKELPF